MGPTIGICKANPDFWERREIWRLLKRLPSVRRIAWLKWCCAYTSPSITYAH